jgi:hypothetical protein
MYFTVVIPWEPNPTLRTEWHPTEPEGPFSTLTRGAFGSATEATEWAQARLFRENAYTVRPCPAPDDAPADSRDPRVRGLLEALWRTPVFLRDRRGAPLENPRYPRILRAVRRAERVAAARAKRAA